MVHLAGAALVTTPNSSLQDSGMVCSLEHPGRALVVRFHRDFPNPQSSVKFTCDHIGETPYRFIGSLTECVEPPHLLSLDSFLVKQQCFEGIMTNGIHREQTTRHTILLLAGLEQPDLLDHKHPIEHQ